MSSKQKITYDDILGKMGMYVDGGKLHKGTAPPQPQPVSKQIYLDVQQESIPIQKNINSMFEKINTPLPPTKPITNDQVLNAIIYSRLQKRKINNIKSTKLIMPTDNIHISKQQTYDVLFNFSEPQNNINVKTNLNL
mgnify:CR=1 FL=1